jgi:hypothetical protein
MQQFTYPQKWIVLQQRTIRRPRAFVSLEPSLPPLNPTKGDDMRSIAFRAGLFTFAIASAVSAGATSSQPVTHVSATETRGVIRDARFSANAVESIGCEMNNAGLVACFMKDAAGVNRSCTTTSASFAATASSIGPNSFVRVFYNAAGACTGLDVYNSSIYLD